MSFDTYTHEAAAVLTFIERDNINSRGMRMHEWIGWSVNHLRFRVCCGEEDESTFVFSHAKSQIVLSLSDG